MCATECIHNLLNMHLNRRINEKENYWETQLSPGSSKSASKTNDWQAPPGAPHCSLNILIEATPNLLLSGRPPAFAGPSGGGLTYARSSASRPSQRNATLRGHEDSTWISYFAKKSFQNKTRNYTTALGNRHARKNPNPAPKKNIKKQKYKKCILKTSIILIYLSYPFKF